MDSRNLNEMRVIDLKKELELRGLTKSGSKKDLIDRLRAYMEVHEAPRNSAGSAREDELPPLQVGIEENEFVKNYLQQRQQLLTQQMEARKRFEAEEAVHSQSECETSGGETETQVKPVPDEPSGAKPDEEVVEASQSVETIIPVANQQHVESVKQTGQSELDTTPSPEKGGNAVELEVSQTVVDSHITTSSADNVKLPVGICDDQTDNQEVLDKHDKEECEHDSARESRPCKRDNQPSSRSSSEGSHSVTSSQGRSRSRSSSDSSSRVRSRSHSGDSHSSQSKPKRAEMRSRSRDRSRSKSEDRSRSGNRSRSRDHSRSRSVERPESSIQEKLSLESHKAPQAELSHVNIDGKSSAVNDLPQPDDANDEDDQVMQSVVSTISESQLSITDIDKGGNAVKPCSETSTDNETGKQSKVTDRTSVLTQDTIAEEKSEAVRPPAEDKKLITFANEVRPNRKRRWGSSSVQPSQPSVNISTDSLKGLIPDIDTTSLSLDLPLELDEDSDSLSKEPSSSARAVLLMSATDEPAASKIRRTVVLDSAAPGEGESADVGKAPVVDSENSNRVTKPQTATSEVPKKLESAPLRTVRALSLAEDPVVGRDREPSPARCPASNVVHVTGLTRPYTLPQLKELLGRTGSLQPDGFWIDNIKSHCYVVYETTEQAFATRQALHGKRWPASNPKILGIEFGTMAEFESHKLGKATPVGTATAQAEVANKSTGLQPDKKETDRLEPSVEPTKDASRDQDHDRDRRKQSPRVTGRPQAKDKQGAVPVREWDRHKVRQSRSSSRERRRRDSNSRSENKDRKENNRQVQDRTRDDKRGHGRSDKTDATVKVQEEPPAKLLDDLFRKTKAMPCIYWLPLTDEQVAEKQAAALAEEQKRAEADRIADLERRKRREERERQEQAARVAERDARQQQLQRRKFTEDDDVPRKRARSRSGGRRDYR